MGLSFPPCPLVDILGTIVQNGHRHALCLKSHRDSIYGQNYYGDNWSELPGTDITLMFMRDGYQSSRDWFYVMDLIPIPMRDQSLLETC